MRSKWVLIDYDGSGFYEIQADDDHPDRDSFDDDDAVRECAADAKRGASDAIVAVAAHNRDAVQVARIRSAVYGGDYVPLTIEEG